MLQTQQCSDFGLARLARSPYNAPISAIEAMADGYGLGFCPPRPSQDCPTALGTGSI